MVMHPENVVIFYGNAPTGQKKRFPFAPVPDGGLVFQAGNLTDFTENVPVGSLLCGFWPGNFRLTVSTTYPSTVQVMASFDQISYFELGSFDTDENGNIQATIPACVRNMVVYLYCSQPTKADVRLAPMLGRV